jgi:CheY-like chemotaxis protein/tetratricopeptide (TPR) repeat protein
MAKEKLLVADPDPRSLRMLQLALRRAGFDVEAAADGQQAMRKLLGGGIQAAVCDTGLPAPDGIAVCRAARAEQQLAAVPIVLVGGDQTAAAKSRALEAGADDYLPKPLLLKEVVQRIQHLLERRRLSDPGAPVATSGSVRDLGLVDVLQSLETCRKSAVIRCENAGQLAQIWVWEGEVIDAELGPVVGDAAFWRLMTWDSGSFQLEFADTELRQARIPGGTQAALVEAMRRVDELGSVARKLPLETRLSIDVPTLAERLADLPDEVNGVLRHFDGERTLRAVIDLSPLDDLATIGVVQRLIEDGVLRPPSRTGLQPWSSRAQRPASAESAVPPTIVQFPAARGLRRARLRREAVQARERIAAGQPVLLCHIVELPARQRAESLQELRQISDAAGEMAKRFAPEAHLSRVFVSGAAADDTPVAPVAVSSAPPALRRRKWPVIGGGLTAVVIFSALLLQPRTDRKDSPWLEARVGAEAPVAPAPPPAAPATAVAPATPAPVAPDTAGYAEAVTRGNDFFRQGKYRAAAGEYKKALAIRPQTVAVLVALGDAWLEADKPRTALEPLEAAARLDPKSGRAQLLLGTAHQSLGHQADAVEAYRRFLDLEPSSEYAKDVRAILAHLGG